MSTPNYVYRATVTGKVADEVKELTQLFAATSVRRAMVKAEKWIESQEIEGLELISIQKETGIVL